MQYYLMSASGEEHYFSTIFVNSVTQEIHLRNKTKSKMKPLVIQPMAGNLCVIFSPRGISNKYKDKKI